MRLRFPMLLAALALAVPMAGCQTPEESAFNAQMTCDAQGLNPNSGAYRRCVAATYQNNRAQADQAATAVAAGAAAGVIGGAIVGAAANDHYYYRRCNRWGCW